MSPTDFIDVEVTGHAKNPTNPSSKNKKKDKKKTEEDISRTKEILMPAISPTMTKGKIVEWLVRTGDTIRKGDPIMVIESEKEVQGARGYRMNQDVNANVDGVLAAIYQQPGQAVDVGAVLGVIVPDFIIDAEIDTGAKSNVTVATGETDDSIKPDPTVAEAVEASETASVPPSPSLIDEMLQPIADTPATDASKQNRPDWVHGHNAETSGMANDHSFYTAHTTHAGGMPPPGPFGGSAFTGSIDSSNSFYSPYPDGMRPPRPPPQPMHQPPMNQRPINQPPNGAGDSFYEAYREIDDPYTEQMADWHQQANNGMGAYYQAERNGQQNTVVTPPPPFDQPRPPVNGHVSTPTPPFPNGHPQHRPQDGSFVSGQVSEASTIDIVTPANEEGAAEEKQRPPQRMTQQATASFGHGVPQPVQPPPPPPVEEERPTSQDVTTSVASDPIATPQELQQESTAHMKRKATTIAAENAKAAEMMENRIANLEQSLHMNGSDSVAFAAMVQEEIANLKLGLANLKKDYDAQVKKLEESYQASLSQVGRDFSGSVEELRDWDSITVTWGIHDFEKTLRKDLTTYTSEEFSVAGYSMTLEMQIFGPNDDGSRDVGFYIMHTGGLNFVPIMIGGSKITIESSSGDNDAVKIFVDDASIEDSHYGWGWKKFFPLNDLKESYINAKGEIQVTATVRVKRVRSCRLNTAI